MLAVEGVDLLGPVQGRGEEALGPDALEFVAGLHRRFTPRREELLRARAERQERIAAGEFPDFLHETRDVRESHRQIAPAPRDLQDRRVEITAPVERKMM